MTPQRFKTLRHMETVRNYIGRVIRELLTRQEQHDQSKLESPEAEAFDIITDSLRGITYGSEEYYAVMRSQEPAIRHHVTTNRHHPEYFSDSYLGMTLIDLIEMLCDWKAATLRHNNGGNLMHSIAINQERWGYSDELRRILENTAQWLNEQQVYHKAGES